MNAGQARQAQALALHAESLELHSFWLPESHFRPGATASPLVGLASLAGLTRLLRLGTTSLLISVHEPEEVARDVVTLQRISGGRLLLGLGRGFERALFRGLGIDPRSKRDRFDQALDRILEACQGALGSPPPMLVAAFGRKGLLQAARRGLPYLASPLESLAALEENFAVHRDHLAKGLPSPGLRAPVMRTVFVAGQASEARSVAETVARELRGFRGRAGSVVARALEGDPEERVLVGEAGAVADRIQLYRERLGMDLLIVRAPAPLPAELQLRSLTRLREAVLPRLAWGDAPPRET